MITAAASAQPIIVQQPTNQAVDLGGTVTFSVSVSNSGPLSYQWLFNSNTIPTNGIITTAAGNGTGSFSGDGGYATNAALNNPFNSAVDSYGNIFVGDAGNGRIRKVDTNGIITTFAGGGAGGGTDGLGDGGPATNAILQFPDGIAFDAFGNVFIVDAQHSLIRKVDTNSIITVFAGGGGGGGTDGLGDGGAATDATLNLPNGLAFDAFGNLFIADWGNSLVRKVDTNGIITVFAGGGAGGGSDGLGDGGSATDATLNRPVGLAFDASGNLYIGDTGNNRVREVDTNGIITVFAGGGNNVGDGGLATNANLNTPNGVAIDSFGNLFIADTGHNLIRKVEPNGIITTAVGGGNGGDGSVATNASLSAPQGVACDSFGNLFIGDYGNNRIRKIAINFNDSPIFTLNNITTTNAGNYQVFITSPSGSVTSSVATLTVIVPPHGATATALVTNGFVVGFNITDAGFGYTNTPLVRIIGGGGSGAQAIAVVSNSIVIAIQITSAGFGYTNLPLVIIQPPVIPSPVLDIGRIPFLLFTNLGIGTNYQLQQAFAWYWTNLPANFTATNSVYVQAMTNMVANLTNYRLTASPVPNQAFAIAQMAGNFVVGATITAGGSGYTSSPTVTITGGGGGNAGGVSQVSGGAVTGITITNAGFGYTNPPTIQIVPPPAQAILPIAVLPGLQINATNLVFYDNYQIQFAHDIDSSWQNWPNGTFTPTNIINSQFLVLTNGNQFFRLQHLNTP